MVRQSAKHKLYSKTQKVGWLKLDIECVCVCVCVAEGAICHNKCKSQLEERLEPVFPGWRNLGNKRKRGHGRIGLGDRCPPLSTVTLWVCFQATGINVCYLQNEPRDFSKAKEGLARRTCGLLRWVMHLHVEAPMLSHGGCTEEVTSACLSTCLPSGSWVVVTLSHA